MFSVMTREKKSDKVKPNVGRRLDFYINIPDWTVYPRRVLHSPEFQLQHIPSSGTYQI